MIKRFMLFAVLAFGLVASSFAQTVLNNIYVLNEGAFGMGNGSITKAQYPVYNPSNLAVHNPSSFGTTLTWANNMLYAAYDTVLYTINPATMAKTDSIFIDGIRIAKVLGNMVYVSRDVAPYFQAYNLTTKANIFSTTGLSGACEDFYLYNNKAYLCVNGFGSQDTLAVISTSTGSITKQIATGLNPQNIVKDGNNFYVFNITNFTNSSVTAIDINTETALSTTSTGLISYGGIDIDTINHNLFFNATNGSFSNSKYWVKSFNTLSQSVNTGNVIDTIYSDAIYTIKYDGVNEQFFCGITDYFSFGKVNRYDKFGNFQNTFATGVGCRSIVLEYGMVSSLSNVFVEQTKVYPNPAKGELHLRLQKPTTVHLYNALGQLVLSQDVTENGVLEVAQLERGMYILQIGTTVHKVILQ